MCSEGCARPLPPTFQHPKTRPSSLPLTCSTGSLWFTEAGLLSGVARRWKVFLNENSKAWAFAEEIPEVNHNSIESFVNTGLASRGVAVVLLHSNLLHPSTSLRYPLTRELLDRHSLPNYQVEAIGKSPLAQVLSATFIGDFVSYYLAVLYGIDPSATPLLDEMKQRLKAMEQQ